MEKLTQEEYNETIKAIAARVGSLTTALREAQADNDTDSARATRKLLLDTLGAYWKLIDWPNEPSAQDDPRPICGGGHDRITRDDCPKYRDGVQF